MRINRAPRGTLGWLLIEIAICSAGIPVAGAIGIVVRFQALDKVVASLKALEAALENGLRGVATAQGPAADAALASALNPASVMQWRMAVGLTVTLMFFAVFFGAFAASFRTGMWQAGAGVAVPSVLTWLAVFSVVALKINSIDLGAFGESVGAPDAGVFLLEAIMWSAMPVAMGTYGGTKMGVARTARADFERAVLPDLITASPGPAQAAQPAQPASPEPPRTPAASWDPLADAEPAAVMPVAAVTPPRPVASASPGQRRAVSCPGCGADNAPVNRACIRCGTALPAEA